MLLASRGIRLLTLRGLWPTVPFALQVVGVHLVGSTIPTMAPARLRSATLCAVRAVQHAGHLFFLDDDDHPHADLLIAAEQRRAMYPSRLSIAVCLAVAPVVCLPGYPVDLGGYRRAA